MRWDESVRCVLPRIGDRIAGDTRRRWAGARIYVTMRAARLEWPPGEPTGAAEVFAADLDRTVRLRGGSTHHTRAILLPLAGTHQLI